MKKLIYLFSLIAVASLTSCSEDDESNTPSATNGINYDGQEVGISSALIEDYGGFSSYNYDFTLSGTSNEVPYSFYAELFSPVIEGQTGFRAGTFSFSTSTPLEPAFYFTDAYIKVDGTTYRVNGGKIVVSGSGTNFTLTTDVTLNNEIPLTVSYSGEFTISSRRTINTAKKRSILK